MTRNQRIFLLVFITSVAGMAVASIREPFDFGQMVLFFIAAVFSMFMFCLKEK